MDPIETNLSRIRRVIDRRLTAHSLGVARTPEPPVPPTISVNGYRPPVAQPPANTHGPEVVALPRPQFCPPPSSPIPSSEAESGPASVDAAPAATGEVRVEPGRGAFWTQTPIPRAPRRLPEGVGARPGEPSTGPPLLSRSLLWLRLKQAFGVD